MREIKFRGKRVSDGKWVFGNLLSSSAIGEVGEHLDGYYYSTVDPETVGEYIGIEDKVKKSIYEGDVLEVLFIDEEKGINETVNTCVVEFDENTAAFGIRSYTDENDIEGVFTGFFDNIIYDFKIIGNIHDYLELLKAKS